MKRKVWVGALLVLVGAGAAAAAWAARRSTADERPEPNIPGRSSSTGMPTATETDFVRQAKATGWLVTDPRTEFGDEDGHPYVIVVMEHGRVKLMRHGDADAFRVVSYLASSGGPLRTGTELPAEIVNQDNLHYSTFLRLVEKYSLNKPLDQS